MVWRWQWENEQKFDDVEWHVIFITITTVLTYSWLLTHFFCQRERRSIHVHIISHVYYINRKPFIKFAIMLLKEKEIEESTQQRYVKKQGLSVGLLPLEDLVLIIKILILICHVLRTHK